MFFRKTPPPPGLADKLAAFEADGFVVFEQAMAHDLLDRFWAEAEDHLSNNPALQFTTKDGVITNEVRWRKGEPTNRPPLRLIDIERQAEGAPAIFLADIIVEFLTARMGAPPTCIQTLLYRKGSEQGPHSDKYLVTPPTAGEGYDRDSLAAAWFAFEDADEENGGLIYYPGSHKIENKKRSTAFQNDADYMRYLGDLCEQHGCRREVFHATKGDVLFWSADFVHAGGPIRDRSRSRKSLVAHYARLARFHRPTDRTRVRRRYNGGYYFR